MCEEQRFPPYLQESSLCVWKTRSPNPACGGWRKSSEAERSTANHAVYKSLVWMAGSNTDEKERGEEEEWKGVRYSTSESAAAWRTFCHGNKYPSPPFVSLLHTLPPSSSLSLLQNALLAPLSHISDVSGWCPFPRLIIQTGLGGGEELAIPSAHNTWTHKQGCWHTSLYCSA